MKLLKIEIKTDVKEVLKESLEMADNLSGVIVLGLFKDTSQMLRTSSMNMMEKSFLTNFLNAWMNKEFDLKQEL